MIIKMALETLRLHNDHRLPGLRLKILFLMYRMFTYHTHMQVFIIEFEYM